MKRFLDSVRRMFPRRTLPQKTAPAVAPLTLIDTLAPPNTSAAATYRQLRHRLVCRLCRPHQEQQSDSVTLWRTLEYFERTANPKKERAS